MEAIPTFVPAKRFPAFSAEWTPDHLGKWFSLSRAKGSDGLPTLSVTLDRGLVNRDDLERKQETNLTAKDHLLVRDGDIAYNMMRMWQGAFGRATTDGIVSPAYVVLRGKTSVDTRFFEYAFRRSRSIYLFWAYSYGLTSDRLRLYGKDFIRIPFVAPTLPEQRKIADFLTAVDGRIGQLIEKKALLEQYKKGMMQQLFSQTLRFKDDHGNPFPDWVEKKLGELTRWSSGGTPSKDNSSYWEGDIPWLSAATMHERYYRDSPLKITEDGVRSGSKIALKGTLLLLVRGSMLWNRIPVGITTRDVAFNQDVKALMPSAKVSAEFLLQWFIASENMLLHRVVGTGIGAGKLDTDEMKRLPFLLPHPAEQKKIAEFLSALDRKIEQVAGQIAKTQTFKRGLLQQMFV